MAQPSCNGCRDRRHVLRYARGDGRRGMGPLVGTRLSARFFRQHRRVGCPRRGLGPIRRLLPHAHSSGTAGARSASPLGRGSRHRTTLRHPRSSHPLPTGSTGYRQPPRLHRTRRARAGRGHGRNLRLLLLPLLRHDAIDADPELDDGRRPGAGNRRIQGPWRPRPN